MWFEMRVWRGCGGGEEDVVLDVGVFVDDDDDDDDDDVLRMGTDVAVLKSVQGKSVQQVNAHTHQWDHRICRMEVIQKYTG